MKKIMAFILVASLACTMATTAFAAQNDTDPVAPDLTTGEVLTNSATIKATTKGNGQVTSCDFDSEPEFSDESYIQNLAVNAERGTTIKLSAKADTGWKFSHWEYSETGEMFSLSRTIPVDVEDDKNLIAVFVEDSMATISVATIGNGQVTSCDFDSEPKFSDETNIQNLAVNAERGTTIKLSAKADTGWKFSHWEYSETGEMFSLSRTILVDVEDDKNLTAVFVEDSMEDSDTSGEASEDEANAESSTIAPGANIPKTGDSTSALALPALLLSSLAAAVFIAVRNRKHDRD